MELNRLNPAYDQPLNVVVSVPGSSSTDIRSVQQTLTLRILNGTSTRPNLSTGSQSERVIHIEVTDEADHCFLYLLGIGENDFHHLKRDQAILVDFPVFPSKLIELIELCQIPSSSSSPTRPSANMSDSSLSQFSARLDTNTGIFSIVESNVFKQLTHISLQLRPGNDHAIKSYLAARLAMAIDLSKQQNQQLYTLSKDIAYEKECRQALSQELHDVRAYQSALIDTMKSQHENEISRLQFIALEAKEEARHHYQDHHDMLKLSYEQYQRDAEKKIKELEDAYNVLKASCNSLEFNFKETSQKKDCAEADRDRLLAEVHDMNQHRRQLEDVRSGLERDMARLEARCEGLSKQLQDKDETTNKTAALHRSSEDSRDILKQQLSMMANTISDLQDQVKNQHLELKQQGSDHHRSQQECKELRDRMKMKSDVIRKQESVIEQLRSKISELEKDLHHVHNDMSSSEMKITSLQRQVDDMNKMMTEKDVTIESNKQVISYLNEEQSKWQLGFVSSPAARTPAKYNVHDVTFTPDTAPSNIIPSASAVKSPQTYEYNPKLSILSKKYIQPSSTSTPASASAATMADKMTVKDDVYARGLANLGLSGKIGEFNLDSLDEMNLFSSPPPSSTQLQQQKTDLSQLSYYASAEKATSQSTPYNSNTRAQVTPFTSNTYNTASATSQRQGKNYAWESPDWIEATLTAAGVRRA